MHIFQTYRQGKIRFVCFDDMCTHSERERERERERESIQGYHQRMMLGRRPKTLKYVDLKLDFWFLHLFEYYDGLLND